MSTAKITVYIQYAMSMLSMLNATATRYYCQLLVMSD